MKLPQPVEAYPHKIHISAYRLLTILKLFSEQSKWTLSDLNTALENNPTIRRGYAAETLLKHLHTLERAGFEFKREWQQGQWVYIMTTHPMKMSFTQDTLNVIFKLNTYLKYKPFLNDHRQFVAFISTLSNAPLNIQQQLLSGNLGDLATPSPDTEESEQGMDALLEKIPLFERYINDHQVLEIGYKPPDGSPIQVCRIEPQALDMYKSHLSLIGQNPSTHQKVRYPLQYIVTHRQLPTQICWQQTFTSVTFKLTGKLAQSYRQYPNERLQAKDDILMVRHTTDDLEALFNRLLKYGTECQIVSPQSVIDSYMEHIDKCMATLMSVQLSVEDDDNQARFKPLPPFERPVQFF